jgi:predicted LPLAT superfamily acyltransferase
MFVVVWESKHGGGGHQLVMDKNRAERISRIMYRAMPDVEVKVVPAADHAAAAVVEREQQGRQQRGPYGASQRRPERSGQRT